jgi:hypothetical protein
MIDLATHVDEAPTHKSGSAHFTVYLSTVGFMRLNTPFGVALVALCAWGVSASIVASFVDSAKAEQETERVILHLSDFHLDPYFGTSLAAMAATCGGASSPWYGLPGCDAPRTLVESAINASAETLAKSTAGLERPPLVYVTGDWLRHELTAVPDAATTATEIFADIIGLLKAQFGAAAGNALIHPMMPVCLGNEDFVPDYHFNVSAAGSVLLMQQVASMLESAGFFAGAGQENQSATFAYCGYAAYVADPGQLRVLTLNTLIWTMDMNPPTTESDPCGQLAWMESQLVKAQAAGESVHLISHIPPSIVFWKPNFYDSFKALLAKYPAVVTAQFYGHVHRFAYVVSEDVSVMPPSFLGGPVTRISNTIPDYAITTVNSASVVTDRVQYYLDSASHTWVQGQSLKKALGTQDLSSASLLAASVSMLDRSSAAGNATWPKLYAMVEGGELPAGDTCDYLTCRLLILCFTVAEDWTSALIECPKGILFQR